MVLWNDEMRERAIDRIKRAEKETRITFQAPKRTLKQNAKMWSMLTDISEQKTHAGRKYAPDRWKAVFMHHLGEEIEFVPSLDMKTFIPLGMHSSEMSIGEMADMITCMEAWGAENGVLFKEPKLDGSHAFRPPGGSSHEARDAPRNPRHERAAGRLSPDAPAARPPLCIECGVYRSDPPSKLCPGCQAYREHQQ